MKKDCVNCKYGKFETYSSGRRNLQKGECTKEVVIPASYTDLRYREYPRKRMVYKGFLRNVECDCWEKGEWLIINV